MIKHRKKFTGDFNINILEYEFVKKVQHILNSMFQRHMIFAINKPTRVTRNTATAGDHSFTNTVTGGIQHRFRIIKIDISDHFPVLFVLNTSE